MLNIKHFIPMLAFAAGPAFAQGDLKSGIDVSSMNPEAKPGTDFFEYAAGGWMKSHPLTAEFSRYSQFEALKEANERQIRGIVEELAATEHPQGSLEQKIGTLYRLAMDSTRRNREGWEPLRPLYDRVQRVATKPELLVQAARLARTGVPTFFAVYCGADLEDSRKNLVQIYQGGISLGERDYYLATDDATRRVRDGYKEYVKKLFVMTGDDEEGKKLYYNFTSPYEPYPVVVTTSKLLTTGADTKCVKLIVLDTSIRSMTEFKQIIGRGTRLREDAGKTFFTILDFRGVCELFHDPEFDGPAENLSSWEEGDPLPKTATKANKTAKTSDNETKNSARNHDDPVVNSKEKVTYVVKGITVEVIGSSIRYLNENGDLITAKFRDYTRQNILKLFGSEAEFLEVWNGEEEKKAILKRLEDNGVFFDQLRKELKNPDADEFDLLCEIAFGRPPMTRQMRISLAARSKFLEKYQGIARAVLEKLVSIYAREGVREVDDIAVLRSEEFRPMGGPVKVVKAFGGKMGYRAAVMDLENALYRPLNNKEHHLTMEKE